jgi:hypothetical protein
MSEVSREGRKDFFSWALRLRARPVVSARSPFTPPKSWKTATSASSLRLVVACASEVKKFCVFDDVKNRSYGRRIKSMYFLELHLLAIG